MVAGEQHDSPQSFSSTPSLFAIFLRADPPIFGTAEATNKGLLFQIETIKVQLIRGVDQNES